MLDLQDENIRSTCLSSLHLSWGSASVARVSLRLVVGCLGLWPNGGCLRSCSGLVDHKSWSSISPMNLEWRFETELLTWHKYSMIEYRRHTCHIIMLFADCRYLQDLYFKSGKPRRCFTSYEKTVKFARYVDKDWAEEPEAFDTVVHNEPFKGGRWFNFWWWLTNIFSTVRAV